jgi:hypothetical protein
MSRLIGRISSRPMSIPNMKKALARLALEWDTILQEAPPDAEDRYIDDARERLLRLSIDTAYLWGTSSPVEQGPQDATLKRRVT